MTRLALYAAGAVAIEGLAALARDAGCAIVGEAHTPVALARLLDRTRADAILASPLPGIEPALWLSERRAPFIVIAASSDTAAMRAALTAGAGALLPSEASAEELRMALDALQRGLIAGAGLDVFEVEPLPENSPLKKMDNVLLAPHNSNSSPAAWERVHWNTIRNLLLGLEIPIDDFESWKTRV